MRSFRKPGRYKRNLHSTYCREHPLVKSSSNIYSFLLKGLFLIAREVSPKKRNNIPFITWNFRGKRVRGDEAATTPFTCPFTSIIVWTASTILKFIVATFPKSVRIFSFDHYLFVIRRDTQLRSILILFSAVLCYVLRSHLRSIHPSLSIPLDKGWAPSWLSTKFKCRGISNYPRAGRRGIYSCKSKRNFLLRSSRSPPDRSLAVARNRITTFDPAVSCARARIQSFYSRWTLADVIMSWILSWIPSGEM